MHWKASNPDYSLLRVRSELDLTQEIEDYPELKASLLRYMERPDMKGYAASELKGKRSARRK